MTAKIRNISRQFKKTYSTSYTNLLVSGCSYTWNNSDKDICSWPYYLRDLAGFDQVIDCSQSGAGSNHIFNSVVNEIETNSELDKHNTTVIIMWSGLTRTDVIATQDVTRPWHDMSNYNFDSNFATLSIFNGIKGAEPLSQLCQQYKRLVDNDAQIYESLIKIIALENYLRQKQFNFVFCSWKDPEFELVHIKSPMVETVRNLLDSVFYLDEYATKHNQKEPDGHPNPNGYLGWTKNHLIPYLIDRKIINLS